MKSYHFKIIVMLLYTSLALGCGGGGGGGGGGGSAAHIRLMTTNILRIANLGDIIIYSITENAYTSGYTNIISGTTDMSIGPTGRVGTLAKYNTFYPSSISMGPRLDYFFSQSATGTREYRGTPNLFGGLFFQGSPGLLVSPASGFVPTIKSPINIGSSWINSYTYQNGASVVEVITVLGKANVTTGLGVFEAYKYKTDETITNSIGAIYSSIKFSYVVPSIGVVLIEKTDSNTITTMRMLTTSIAF